jgi:hypothetical protein
MPQERLGGQVGVDADEVDRAFDDLFERGAEARFVDVVLILADADGPGIDLDELREGVLEAAGDGDGSPDRNIVIGELAGALLGSAVDARPGLADHDTEGPPPGREGRDRLAHKELGLPARRPVAHGDELDAVGRDHFQ